MIQSKLKNGSDRSDKGYQPNGPARNQKVNTRENWKTGDRILRESREGTTSSPLDSRAMEASKNRRVGIFPGERNAGKSTSNSSLLDRISNSTRTTRSSSDRNRDQADRNTDAFSSDAINRQPRNTGSNSNEKNNGRGTNVTTEDERNELSKRQTGSQNLLDMLNGRNPGSPSGRNESSDRPGKDDENPRQPERGESSFEDLLDDGKNKTDQPAEETSQDEQVPESDNEDNETPSPEQDANLEDSTDEQTGNQDDQESGADHSENPVEDETNASEAETEDELAPSPDPEDPHAEDSQTNEKLDSIIELIGRLPIGNNGLPTGPIVIERPIVVAPTSPAVVQATKPERVRTDLEVVDIRFVDLGNEKMNEGPRFRVVLKNHNNRYSLNQIQVDLVAGISLADKDSPRKTTSGIIETIAPKGLASVDIRVNRDALKLVHPQTNEQAAFAQLAAIVEPGDAFEDVEPANNIVVKDVNDVEHVELRLKNVPSSKLIANSQVVLNGEGFQFKQGAVVLVVNKKPYPLKVTRWSPTVVEAVVPNFVLLQSINAQLVVVTKDKKYSEPLAVSVSN